jgi:hypothetical protein
VFAEGTGDGGLCLDGERQSGGEGLSRRPGTVAQATPGARWTRSWRRAGGRSRRGPIRSSIGRPRPGGATSQADLRLVMKKRAAQSLAFSGRTAPPMMTPSPSPGTEAWTAPRGGRGGGGAAGPDWPRGAGFVHASVPSPSPSEPQPGRHKTPPHRSRATACKSLRVGALLELYTLGSPLALVVHVCGGG